MSSLPYCCYSSTIQGRALKIKYANGFAWAMHISMGNACIHGQCMYPCTAACQLAFFQLPVYAQLLSLIFMNVIFHKTGFGEKLKSQTQVCNQKSADYINQEFWLYHSKELRVTYYMPHIETIRKYEDQWNSKRKTVKELRPTACSPKHTIINGCYLQSRCGHRSARQTFCFM